MSKPLEKAADGLLAVLGYWQFLFLVAVRAEWSFDALVQLAWLPPVLAAATVWWVHRAPREAEPGRTPEALHPMVPDRRFWITLGLAIAGLGLWAARLLPAAVAAAAWLAHLWPLLRGPVRLPAQRPVRWLDGAVVAAASVGSALYTLAIHRAEGDDGYYLGQVVGNLEHRDLPLMSFDVLHGDVSLPVQQPAHRSQSFEALVAAVTDTLGAHPWDVYYVLLPPLFAAMVAPALWLLGRTWFGRTVATPLSALGVWVLTEWGGHHYAVGNYAFVRMYQGKAVLVSVVIPLVLWAATRLARRPDLRSTWMLALGLGAAGCCSSTGLLVAPLAASLAVLATLTAERRSALGGLVVAVLPTVVTLLLVRADLSSGHIELQHTGQARGLRQVLGNDGRVGLALLAWLALPAVWARTGRSPAHLARFMGLVALLLFSRLLPAALGSSLGKLFSWRLYWAVPSAAWVAAFIVLGTHIARRDASARVRSAALWSTLAFALAVGSLGLSTWNTGNRSHTEWATHRLPVKRRALALAVLEHTTAADLALLPEVSAVVVAAAPEAPRLVFVRDTYLRHLAHVLPEREIRERIAMANVITGEGLGLAPTPFADALDRRCVTAVSTLKQSVVDAPMLPTLLSERGFTQVPLEDEEGQALWVRDASACVPEPTP